jgi:hypothetical protein
MYLHQSKDVQYTNGASQRAVAPFSESQAGRALSAWHEYQLVHSEAGERELSHAQAGQKG